MRGFYLKQLYNGVPLGFVFKALQFMGVTCCVMYRAQNLETDLAEDLGHRT